MKQSDRPVPPVGRRERNKAEKKERVFLAARELFTRDGYEKTSMKTISVHADVGFGTLFLIADGKRDLLFKLFHTDVVEIRNKIRDNIDYAAGIPDIFLAMLYPYFDLFAENIQLSRDYLREVTFAAATAEGQDDVHFGEFFVPTAQSVLNELKRHGQVREDLSTNVAAEALYATFMGAVRTWLRKDNPKADEGKAYLRSIYEIVAFGLR